MKAMFIVYHDITTNARTQEILKCAQKISKETIFVSYSTPFDSFNCRRILTGGGKRNYFSFIRDSIRAIKTENPNIVILHDNYTAIILRWLVKRKKDVYIIYDSSELYIDKKPHSIKELVAEHMKYFEKKYLKYADIVIAANIERANIMKKYYKLRELPLVFYNIRRIDDQYDLSACDKKYGYLFSDNKFCIVYAGGIRKQRKTFELAEAVGNLGDEYRLIITGASTESDKEAFHLMLRQKGFSNVFYIGFIPRSELRYMFYKANISVSIFAQDTINNIYCASGKLYESLFEGTPVLTSENPPLKRICNEYKVGVSNNNFMEGILELRNNYDVYCRNVQSYISTLDVEGRINKLAETINNKMVLNIN